VAEQIEVLVAVKALVADALPEARVRGFDGDSSIPMEIHEGGEVVGQAGDPGDPETDLSPPVNHYRHRIPLDVAPPSLVPAIEEAVRADRTLGGLVDWLETEAADLSDRTLEGVTTNWAGLMVVAHYSTPA
jgi:hypothetical protein